MIQNFDKYPYNSADNFHKTDFRRTENTCHVSVDRSLTQRNRGGGLNRHALAAADGKTKSFRANALEPEGQPSMAGPQAVGAISRSIEPRYLGRLQILRVSASAPARLSDPPAPHRTFADIRG